MKWIFWLAFFTASGASAGELNLRFTGLENYLVPATTSSCEAALEGALQGTTPRRDIPPFYLALLNPVIEFQSGNGAEHVQIEGLRLRVDSPFLRGGFYQCDLTLKELSAVFAPSPVRRWSGQLSANSSVRAGEKCQALRCGGINVIPESGNFEAQGQVTVFGKAIDPIKGSEEPIEFSRRFQVLNVW